MRSIGEKRGEDHEVTLLFAVLNYFLFSILVVRETYRGISGYVRLFVQSMEQWGLLPLYNVLAVLFGPMLVSVMVLYLLRKQESKEALVRAFYIGIFSPLVISVLSFLINPQSPFSGRVDAEHWNEIWEVFAYWSCVVLVISTVLLTYKYLVDRYVSHVETLPIFEGVVKAKMMILLFLLNTLVVVTAFMTGTSWVYFFYPLMVVMGSLIYIGFSYIPELRRANDLLGLSLLFWGIIVKLGDIHFQNVLVRTLQFWSYYLGITISMSSLIHMSKPK